MSSSTVLRIVQLVNDDSDEVRSLDMLILHSSKVSNVAQRRGDVSADHSVVKYEHGSRALTADAQHLENERWRHAIGTPQHLNRGCQRGQPGEIKVQTEHAHGLCEGPNE